ncbi:hypothetical protein FBU30_000867 [Linnemannia zychae]|nr:hypothetical protein FBU30_000867 [Linnemannia zychae]
MTIANPFHLPELRLKLSRLVDVSDAPSCALACKAWTLDFFPLIWHSVNFMEQPKFTSLSPDIISKHGHRIRTVQWLANDTHISLLDNIAVNGLEELKIYSTATSITDYSRLSEIVQRNSSSLQSCVVFLDNVSSIHNTFALCQVLVPSRVSMSDSLPSMTSILTELCFKRSVLEQDDLMTVLQTCPRLKKLHLGVVSLFGRMTNIDFKHTSLKKLEGAVECIFPPDNPSLLTYFPNLEFLKTWTDQPQTEIPTDRIKSDIAEYCSCLTEYGLKSYNDFMIHFCAQIIQNPTMICIDFDSIATTPRVSAQIVDAVLQHRASLKKVMVYDIYGESSYETEDLMNITRVFNVSTHHLQWIPRTCSRLEKLDFHLHEVNMDDIEADEWVCKDLKKLATRIQGLDTKEKIKRAIDLWRNGVREQWRKQAKEENKNLREKHEEDKEVKKEESLDTSIEARVARHLLKLEKLEEVWLGGQTCKLLYE